MTFKILSLDLKWWCRILKDYCWYDMNNNDSSLCKIYLLLFSAKFWFSWPSSEFNFLYWLSWESYSAPSEFECVVGKFSKYDISLWSYVSYNSFVKERSLKLCLVFTVNSWQKLWLRFLSCFTKYCLYKIWYIKYLCK